MNLLNKLFVSEEESTASVIPAARTAPQFAIVGDASAQLPDTGLLSVEEIYDKHCMADASKSIFRAEEFGSKLPTSIVGDIRKNTVVGIITAAGLQVADLTADAEARIAALQTTMEMTAQGTADMTAEAEAKIADCEAQIEALKISISDRQVAQEQQKVALTAEIERIGNIVKSIS